MVDADAAARGDAQTLEAFRTRDNRAARGLQRKGAGARGDLQRGTGDERRRHAIVGGEEGEHAGRGREVADRRVVDRAAADRDVVGLELAAGGEDRADAVTGHEPQVDRRRLVDRAEEVRAGGRDRTQHATARGRVVADERPARTRRQRVDPLQQPAAVGREDVARAAIGRRQRPDEVGTDGIGRLEADIGGAGEACEAQLVGVAGRAPIRKERDRAVSVGREDVDAVSAHEAQQIGGLGSAVAADDQTDIRIGAGIDLQGGIDRGTGIEADAARRGDTQPLKAVGAGGDRTGGARRRERERPHIGEQWRGHRGGGGERRGVDAVAGRHETRELARTVDGEVAADRGVPRGGESGGLGTAVRTQQARDGDLVAEGRRVGDRERAVEGGGADHVERAAEIGGAGRPEGPGDIQRPSRIGHADADEASAGDAQTLRAVGAGGEGTGRTGRVQRQRARVGHRRRGHAAVGGEQVGDGDGVVEGGGAAGAQGPVDIESSRGGERVDADEARVGA